MIFASDRPMTNRERTARWRYNATLAGYEFVLGPRFDSDFGRDFGREYERQEMLSARPCILEE